MIAYLRGKVAFCEQNYVVIDVNGVGFKVFVAPSTAASLVLKAEGKKEGEVVLHVHFHVRQDAVELFGFLDPAEKVMFETLLGVDGIGPRVALGILCSSRVGDLVKAIMTGNEQALRRLPGVGPKTAKRMIIELKDLLGRRGFRDSARGEVAARRPLLGTTRKCTSFESIPAKADTETTATEDESGLEDAVDWAEAALITLGYSEREVKEVMGQVLDDAGEKGSGGERIDAQYLVRSALRILSAPLPQEARGEKNGSETKPR